MNDQVNGRRSAASSRSLPNLVHLAARTRLTTSSLAENDAPVGRARSTDQGANSNNGRHSERIVALLLPFIFA